MKLLFGLVAQQVRATDCLYSGNANMWYERHPYKMEIVGSTPTTATMKKLVEQQIFNLWVMGSSPICITIDDSVNL